MALIDLDLEVRPAVEHLLGALAELVGILPHIGGRDAVLRLLTGKGIGIDPALLRHIRPLPVGCPRGNAAIGATRPLSTDTGQFATAQLSNILG
ncbi:hypothetical protein D3C84_1148920 [compost metagenome]